MIWVLIWSTIVCNSEGACHPDIQKFAFENKTSCEQGINSLKATFHYKTSDMVCINAYAGINEQTPKMY